MKLKCLLSSQTHPTAPEQLEMAMETGCDSWEILRTDLVGLLRNNMVLFSLLCKHASQEFAIVTTKRFLPFFWKPSVHAEACDTLTKAEFRESPGPTLLEPVSCKSHSEMEDEIFQQNLPPSCAVGMGITALSVQELLIRKHPFHQHKKAEIRSAKSCPLGPEKKPYTGDT